MKVKVKDVSGLNRSLPQYATEGSSGIDLPLTSTMRVVSKKSGELIELEPSGSESYMFLQGTRVLIDTKLQFEIPLGYELQIRPRSSCFKRGIHIELGTIDSDYRGNVWILAEFRRKTRFSLNDSIAQAVLVPIERMELVEDTHLNSTERDGNGFGSSGGYEKG